LTPGTNTLFIWLGITFCKGASIPNLCNQRKNKFLRSTYECWKSAAAEVSFLDEFPSVFGGIMKSFDIGRNILPRTVGIAGAIAGLVFAGTAVSAKPSGEQYFVLGGGGAMVTSQQPCPHIPCNTGDTCSCITASGDLKANAQSHNKSYPGTFKLEISADNSATMNNGAGGHCFASTGKFHLKFPVGTMDIPFSAWAAAFPVCLTRQHLASALRRRLPLVPAIMRASPLQARSRERSLRRSAQSCSTWWPTASFS